MPLRMNYCVFGSKPSTGTADPHNTGNMLSLTDFTQILVNNNLERLSLIFPISLLAEKNLKLGLSYWRWRRRRNKIIIAKL